MTSGMIYVIPCFAGVILLYALYKRTAVYDAFIEGAQNGLKTVISVIPSVIAVMTAAEMLRASGAMDILLDFLSPYTEKIGFPAEVLPLALIRPLSGSGASGIYADILRQCGADSRAGMLASVINGTTETTFYCMSVYFSGISAKNNLRILPYAMLGDAICIITALITINFFQ